MVCESLSGSGSPPQGESYLVVKGGRGEGKIPANFCSIPSLNPAPKNSNYPCGRSHRSRLREPRRDSIQNEKQTVPLKV